MVFIKINAVIFLGGEEGGNGESRIYWRHVSFEIGISYEGEGVERQLDMQFLFWGQLVPEM